MSADRSANGHSAGRLQATLETGIAAGDIRASDRTLRAQRNLAQGQLAEAVGVSRQTINSIETGRYTSSLPLAMALARYFCVTVEEMFDDQGC